jgi:CheY-like chemotaxis protein
VSRLEALRRHVEQIHQAALRGAQLTRQLLLFSRHQEIQTRVVDLGELLSDVETALDRLSEELEPAVERARAGSTPATFLLVEDDDMFRGLLQHVLESQGHRVLMAEHPAAALALAASYGDSIQLLLSDVVMPGGSGADLARQLKGLFPRMKVVLMSGYPGDALANREADTTTADAFLEKPFATDDLLRLIRDLLAG